MKSLFFFGQRKDRFNNKLVPYNVDHEQTNFEKHASYYEVGTLQFSNALTVQAPGTDPVIENWSYFTQTLCKLDHFIMYKKISYI